MSIFIATCLIVAVTDGDTLSALCENRQIKVRLAEIDAPEKMQPFGINSKQSLVALCLNKKANIKPYAIDRYHRTVALVICNEINANEEQLNRGMAWVYDKYMQNNKLYVLQGIARTSKIGLWSDVNAVPPWVWRHTTQHVTRK